MRAEFLADGGSVAVAPPADRRIGAGPWARGLALAVVGDECAPVALRGAELARAGAVSAVRIELGAVFAQVADGGDTCEVSLLAARVPAGIWSAMTRYAKNRGTLHTGVEGRVQSAQLEHLMSEDWSEPLVPHAAAIARACTGSERGDCEHVAALGYVLADAIDENPALLLRWRGCVDGAAEFPRRAVGDPWRGAPLAALAPPRPRPFDAVLKRLGQSGIRVGDEDLADVLRRAYAVFADGERS